MITWAVFMTHTHTHTHTHISLSQQDLHVGDEGLSFAVGDEGSFPQSESQL